MSISIGKAGWLSRARMWGMKSSRFFCFDRRSSLSDVRIFLSKLRQLSLMGSYVFSEALIALRAMGTRAASLGCR